MNALDRAGDWCTRTPLSYLHRAELLHGVVVADVEGQAVGEEGIWDAVVQDVGQHVHACIYLCECELGL